MPFKSAEQRRLFQACRENSEFSEQCPPPEVIKTYLATEARAKGRLKKIKERMKAKKRETGA